MRRVSLFWPLILISIGTLWLLRNMGMISAENLWALVQLWPILLIGLGLGLILRSWWPPAWNLVAFLTVAAIVLGVIFAPQLGLVSGWGIRAQPVVLSGQIFSQERPVKNFQAITIGYPSQVIIRQGEAESLTIEADESLLETIRTEVRGGTLYIGFKEDWYFGIRVPGQVRITITVVSLDSIRLSGAGEVVVEGLKADNLEVVLSGAGDLRLEGLEADRFEGTISGAGKITANGKVEKQNIQISGLGSYRGKDLKSSSTEVRISGAGSAEVRVEETLEAYISGAGSVDYYGRPQVFKHITGAGSLNKKGD